MPRQKKTEAVNPLERIADRVSGLPDLTAQQFRFVSGLLDGMTATAAYRAAYDCSRMKPESIWVAASRLRSDNKVALWLQHSKLISLESAGVTFDGHLGELNRLKHVSEASGNMGAAVQAEIHRGKAAGLYVEKHEHQHSIAPDTLQALQDIARIDPREAQRLADEHGISWKAPIIEHRTDENPELAKDITQG